MQTSQHEYPLDRASVLGGGSFGSALGIALAKKGTRVSVHVRDAIQAKEVNTARENIRYLPGISLPDNMHWTCHLNEALADSQLIVLAIPTQFLRSFCREWLADAKIPLDTPLVVCAKGIELKTLAFPIDIVRDELPAIYAQNMCVLGGPSFASELARGLPTGVSIAAEEPELRVAVRGAMSSRAGGLRCYSHEDVLGAEVAGAMKNVIALASGACSGLGLGQNARAGIVCRGLAEMTRLARRLGSTGKAMQSLSGVGDLMLTCNSELSRNFRMGFAFGAGKFQEEAESLERQHMVAEGIATSEALETLRAQLDLELPVCQAVFNGVHGGINAPDVMAKLLNRPLREENE